MRKKIIVLLMIGIFAVPLIVSGCAKVGDEVSDTTEISALGVSAETARLKKIVVFEKGIPEVVQQKLITKHGGNIVKPLKLINAQAIQLPEKLPEQAKKAILKEAGVLRVDDDIIVKALPKPEKPPGKPDKPGEPEDPAPLQQLSWGANRIDSELANDAGKTGAGVKVAVLDTGIDLDHSDLNVLGSINTINSRKSADDDNGHGSHCAGIIAALDNEIGVKGVAPGASLYAVKVLDRKGSGYLSDIIEGIDWSIANGIEVINMSLGATVHVQSFRDAVASANAAGITVVAAAGNDYGGPVNYPAAYPEAIAVSATNQSDSLANFSNIGDEVELAAPGVDILSTYKNGGYEVVSGTSMSCPHVSGTVALIIASGRANSPSQIRSVLAVTADDLGVAGADTLFGAGLVDAEEAATGIQTNP